MKLAEYKKVVPLISAGDFGAGLITFDSFRMTWAHSATVIIIFEAVTGNSDLMVYSGALAAGLDSAMVFDYAYSSGVLAAASADVMGSTTTAVAASGATLTAASVTSAMMILEIESTKMDLVNQEEWVTITIDSTASPGVCTAVAILNPRYADDQSLTVLV